MAGSERKRAAGGALVRLEFFGCNCATGCGTGRVWGGCRLSLFGGMINHEEREGANLTGFAGLRRRLAVARWTGWGLTGALPIRCRVSCKSC
jgi:hypothetical protein